MLWINCWLSGTSVTQGLRLDATMRERVRQTLSVVPPPLRREPLLALPYGAPFYFFRDAETPPFDWLLLPSMRYQSPGDLQRVADWLTARRVPLVLVQRSERGLGFLTEASPLREVLRSDYTRLGSHRGQLILLRSDLSIPARPEPGAGSRPGRSLTRPLGNPLPTSTGMQ